MALVLCGVIISLPRSTNKNTLSTTAVTPIPNIAAIENAGAVLGASSNSLIFTTTIPPTLTPIPITVGVVSLPNITFAKNMKISGKLPRVCLNTDGNFCQANLAKVGQCTGGICGATALTFTVTPDANGNWTDTVPAGLDPGSYEVTIKDASGNVLEVTKFTVVTKSVLPNTGVVDDLLYISVGGFVLLLVAAFFSRRKKIKMFR